jgi:protein-L-isoaspartate O-methyltransferase
LRAFFEIEIERKFAMREVKIKLSDEAREVLSRSAITTDSVKLPEQLDRDLYLEIAKVFKAAGGKWVKGKGLHLFTRDPREVLGLAVVEGAIVDEKKTLQQFFTPPVLADQMVELADLFDGARVLEPSAGDGAILRAITRALPICQMAAIELDEKLFWSWMRMPGICKARQGDFLMATPSEFGMFNRIIMNPPFRDGQDIAHIQHALQFLAPGGRLVAICGDGPDQRSILKPAACAWQQLPAGTFHESGTEVRAVLLSIIGPILKTTHGKKGVAELPSVED